MIKKTPCILILLLIFLIASAPGAAAQLRFGAASGDPATWTAKAEMKSKTDGVITITAKINPKWHIYGLETPKDVPVATEIGFAATGMVLTGKITASPAPKPVYDSAFGAEIPYWEEGTVTFTQPFKVTAKDASTEIKIKYIGCSGIRCDPPKTVTLKLSIPNSKK